jgi:lipoyl(octanoyl) transferase
MEWITSTGLVPYEEAVAAMEQRVSDIHHGTKPELMWFLEHPPLYTAGSSSKATDLLDDKHLPVYETGRGGQYTYHGPGQRIVYVMLDLTTRGRDVKAFVHTLEQWIIDSLGVLGIQGERRCGRIGIWVQNQGREEKIAALGVRLRRWVSYHGIAININPDLSHFQGIVPCGLSNFGVTSCAALGVDVSLNELDFILKEQWQKQDYFSNQSHNQGELKRCL